MGRLDFSWDVKHSGVSNFPSWSTQLGWRNVFSPSFNLFKVAVSCNFTILCTTFCLFLFYYFVSIYSDAVIQFGPIKAIFTFTFAFTSRSFIFWSLPGCCYAVTKWFWSLGDFLLAQDEPIPYYLQYSGYVSIFQNFVTVFTTHFFTTTQFNVCSIIGRWVLHRNVSNSNSKHH